MAKLTIYPTPLDSRCQLQHDSGFSVDGKQGNDENGRPCQYFDIPDSTPNGWGSRLVISAPNKITFMNRGLLLFAGAQNHTVEKWLFFLDDIILADVPPPIIITPPNPNPPNPMPSDPKGIIDWTYANGHFNLATKEGCGQFTEECCKNLHNNNSISWGFIRKIPPQNNYNGHAVDAVMLLVPKDSTSAGIYDIILSSESSDARPAFNYVGPANKDLWYYPA